jgi:hypothetical protein
MCSNAACAQNCKHDTPGIAFFGSKSTYTRPGTAEPSATLVPPMASAWALPMLARTLTPAASHAIPLAPIPATLAPPSPAPWTHSRTGRNLNSSRPGTTAGASQSWFRRTGAHPPSAHPPSARTCSLAASRVPPASRQHPHRPCCLQTHRRAL